MLGTVAVAVQGERGGQGRRRRRRRRRAFSQEIKSKILVSIANGEYL